MDKLSFPKFEMQDFCSQLKMLWKMWERDFAYCDELHATSFMSFFSAKLAWEHDLSQVVYKNFLYKIVYDVLANEGA